MTETKFETIDVDELMESLSDYEKYFDESMENFEDIIDTFGDEIDEGIKSKDSKVSSLARASRALACEFDSLSDLTDDLINEYFNAVTMSGIAQAFILHKGLCDEFEKFYNNLMEEGQKMMQEEMQNKRTAKISDIKSLKNKSTNKKR